MATPHGLPPVTIGWRQWSILVAVFVIVLLMVLFLAG
jgi:hypothetical protein